MTFRRAVLLLLGISVIGYAAAQTVLPSTTTPLPDLSNSEGLKPDRERRPSPAHALSAADHDLLSRAFDAADRGDWLGAKGLAENTRGDIGKRLIQWRYVLDKNSGASFAEIDAFLRANPGWPMRDTIMARAEVAMDPTTAPAAIVGWFGDRTPETGIGMIRLGDALIAAGRTAQGTDWIRRGWVSGAFRPDQELAIVQKDGGLLTPEVDRARLSNLISTDQIPAAQRELSRVADDVQALGRARIAYRSSRAAGEMAAGNLPASVANDPDLIYDRARAARRANDNATAAAFFARPGIKPFITAHSSKWWGDANLTIRALIQSNSCTAAHNIAADTGLTTGTEFSESEFLAGWVALRCLKNPTMALAHFQRLEAGVGRPISKSRARYWQGRAWEAKGDKTKAIAAYRAAAQMPDTFYGQMALARVDASPAVHLTETAADASGVADAAEADDVTKAIRVLGDLGQENILRLFALRAYELHPEAARAKYLMQMLTDMGFREIAVRVAKSASYAGVTFQTYLYPVIPVPSYAGPGTAPETAFVLGLIRQETEFDPDAVSGAGARGIMQMMLSSAQLAASQAGLPYRPNDLTADPTYNMQLGMTEFAGDLRNWNGSYVLAIAAYNAGPGNARKWIAAMGDPRTPGIDVIDWVELIPFNETRNYVQRVLENTQVYRVRLSGHDAPLRTVNDLYAPRPPEMGVLR
jgi:soluble lytic murein transglycosylase